MVHSHIPARDTHRWPRPARWTGATSLRGMPPGSSCGQGLGFVAPTGACADDRRTSAPVRLRAFGIRRRTSTGAGRLLALACACMLCGLDSAAAEDRPGDAAGYRESVRKALQEYQVGNWAEAQLFFEEAHDLYPNARTLRGLGLAAFALRDYVTAIGHLEAALVNRVQPLTAPLREQIADHLARARRFVARVALDLEPPDADVMVNAQPAARTPDGSVWLNPGTHELVARRAGYASAMRRVSVQAGMSLSVRLALVPERETAQVDLSAAGELAARAANRAGELATAAQGATPAAAAAESEPASADPGSSSSLAPWLVVGLSVAMAATGGVVLATTLDDIDGLQRPRPGTSWSEVEGKYRRTPPLSAAGVGMLAVGLAGAGAGLAGLLWPGAASGEVALSLSPTGATVRGDL